MTMMFVGGEMHGKHVPAWAQDGRSWIVVESPVIDDVKRTLTILQHEYCLRMWRYPSGFSVPFFAAARMDQKAIDQAALELLGER